MGESRKQRDFFISYTQADSAWAEWIAWQLEDAGYTTLVQAWDFRPGEGFVERMHQAIERSSRTIAVLSPGYLASAFATSEWQAVFTKDPTGEHGLLLPVRVVPCQPPGLLAGRIYLDLVDLDEQAAAQRLLDGVARGRSRPAGRVRLPGSTTQPTRGGPRFPGRGPAIFNVPPPNPYFSGRGELLDSLRAELRDKVKAPVVPAHAIHGLAGVGKSELVKEYAYRYKADYELIWWVDAAVPLAIPGRLARLAPRLDLAEQADQEEAAARVLNELAQRERWLVIFDNADRPSELERYRPAGRGHVLITSRNPDWGGIGTPVRMDVLEREEAISFLLRRTHSADTKDTASADALAEELGDLPLALEQAGAYMGETGMSLTEYLELFRRRREELLGKGEPTGYTGTVETTWRLSIERVARDARAADDLLRLCAFFAPQAIPLELVFEHTAELPPDVAYVLHDEVKRWEALRALQRYSLITRDKSGIHVHRLVQAVVRMGLNPADEQRWAAVAVRLVQAAFPPEGSDSENWLACARLLPHALVAVDNAAAAAVEPEATVALLIQVGSYLRGRAELRQARRLLERALAIQEAQLGPNHPQVAATLSNLGKVLHDLGDLAAARVAIERALEIYEAQLELHHPEAAWRGVLHGFDEPAAARSALEGALAINEAPFGLDHWRVVWTLNTLGTVLRDQGDLASARIVLEQSLAIRQAQLGPDHMEVAPSLINLGLVLHDLGELAGAQAAIARALTINEALYGPDHWRVGWTLSNLGTILRDLGDLAGAKGVLERSLAIRRAWLGPEHPKIATTLSNLGTVLRDLADLVAAQAILEQALAILEAGFGPNHPKVATTLNNLGTVLRDLGDLSRAQGTLERSLAIRETHLGPDHWKIGWSLNNLGTVLRDRGDLAGAKEMIERSVAVRTVQLGPEHWRVGWSLNNLGTVLRDLGDLAEARTVLERAAGILERQLGPDHWKVAWSLDNLGTVLRDLVDLVAAQAILEQALAILEARFGPNHPRVATTLNNLGTVLRDRGDLAGAKEMIERSVVIRETHLGPDHWRVGWSLNNLGTVLRGQGDLAGAKEMLERALAIRETQLGADHWRVGCTLNDLGMALRDLGDLAAARTVLEQAVGILERQLGPDHWRVASSLDNLRNVSHKLGDLSRPS